MTEQLTLLSSLWQIIIVYIGSVTFYQNIKCLFKTHKEAEFKTVVCLVKNKNMQFYIGDIYI